MLPTISVCMGIKNGATFIHDQISSILPQLAVDDDALFLAQSAAEVGEHEEFVGEAVFAEGAFAHPPTAGGARKI